jgi:hypothetical protein
MSIKAAFFEHLEEDDGDSFIMFSEKRQCMIKKF